jgi:hypothetical protein
MHQRDFAVEYAVQKGALDGLGPGGAALLQIAPHANEAVGQSEYRLVLPQIFRCEASFLMSSGYPKFYRCNYTISPAPM